MSLRMLKTHPETRSNYSNTGQLFRPHLVSSAVRSQLSMQENDFITKKDDLSDSRSKWLNCL